MTPPNCIVCQNHKAVKHPQFGWLPCEDCQLRHKQLSKPKETQEITTDEVKESRQLYADDIEQPFREGVFNKRYYDKYGTAGVQVTEQDIKNAKDVWTENHWYREE